MKKFLCAVFAVLLSFNCVFAQDEAVSDDDKSQEQSDQHVQSVPKWKTSGILSWAYNQTAASSNWTGKEKFSRMWQTKLFLSLERDSEYSNWLTTLKEEYGESDSKDISEVSLDHLEFNTLYTYKIYKLLQPYVSFFVKSQNNKFWDPVTYIESSGLNFTVFENEINTLKVRAGGALKQTDDSVKGSERSAGAEGVLNYNLLFHKDAKFVSDARIFESFDNGEDFRWENKLFLKTGPWFTTEFGYKVYFERARIEAHSWPNDIETLVYVAFGLSFNIFQ
ncbi:MAG: DUF481 domain-containing protein [Endomicrobia bacterium]|nr:DUF481 domain-containing protein [Endomicrobiia bacterium]